jgi:hypothetical protein
MESDGNESCASDNHLRKQSKHTISLVPFVDWRHESFIYRSMFAIGNPGKTAVSRSEFGSSERLWMTGGSQLLESILEQWWSGRFGVTYRYSVRFSFSVIWDLIGKLARIDVWFDLPHGARWTSDHNNPYNWLKSGDQGFYDAINFIRQPSFPVLFDHIFP